MINKKGLIGKILLVILLLVILILVFLGITAYQASSTIKVVQEESAKIQTSTNLLTQQRDCSQIENIELSVGKIENAVLGACKNPFIKIIISKTESIPVKCENLSAMKTDFENKFAEAKDYCANPDKYSQAIANGSMTQEEMMALAQKYGIKI